MTVKGQCQFLSWMIWQLFMVHLFYCTDCVLSADAFNVHSPPKETQHLVQELPWPQFGVNERGKKLLAEVVSPILSHRSSLEDLKYDSKSGKLPLLTTFWAHGVADPKFGSGRPPRPSVAFLLVGSVDTKIHMVLLSFPDWYVEIVILTQLEVINFTGCIPHY